MIDQPTPPPTPSSGDSPPIPPTAVAPESPPATTPVPASSFGKVAAMLARRTTDLLAIAILGGGLLLVGGQLRDWWRTSEEDVQNPLGQLVAPATFGESGAPVWMELGPSGRLISKQKLQGTLDAALKIVVDRCGAIVMNTASPPAADPASAEAQWLAEVAKLTAAGQLKPAWEASGVGRVYLVRMPSLVVYGVRDFPAPTGGGERVRRIVCWGMLQPQSKDEWTAFLMTAAGPAFASSVFPDLDLPAGGEKYFAVTDDGGGGLRAFGGKGTLDEWQQQLSAAAARRGWVPLADWTATDVSRAARFEASRADVVWQVNIELTPSSDGRVWGLLAWTSRAPAK